MGFLDLFSAKASPDVQLLPSGSVTVNREGKILASTVSSAVPEAVLLEIGERVLQLFKQSRIAQVPLAELTLNFSSLQITARELRGGAMIFLTPRHSFNVPSTQQR